MEKSARKELEKQLINLLTGELKKVNEKATTKTAKHIKEAVKTVTKKFAKASITIQKEKEAAMARKPIPVKTASAKSIAKPVRKVMPKKATKTFLRKK